MHKEHSPEYLVDEILNVIIGEFLPGIDDPVQICFHEFCDYINICISSSGFRLQDIDDPNDIVMMEKFLINCSLLNNLISRTMRFASIKSSNAFITYVIKTLLSLSLPFYFSNDRELRPPLHMRPNRSALLFHIFRLLQRECRLLRIKLSLSE